MRNKRDQAAPVEHADLTEEEAPEDTRRPQTVEDEDSGDKEPVVKYIGEFTRREISVDDWNRAGITDMPAVVWDNTRNMEVPASVFSKQALQVLRQEGHFEVP